MDVILIPIGGPLDPYTQRAMILTQIFREMGEMGYNIEHGHARGNRTKGLTAEIDLGVYRKLVEKWRQEEAEDQSQDFMKKVTYDRGLH